MKFSLCCFVVAALVCGVLSHGHNASMKHSMHIKMKCTPDYMEAMLDKKRVGSLDTSELHLEDKDCKTTRETDDFIIFRTALDGCDTSHNISDDGKYLVYYNSIIGDLTKPNDSSLITREHEAVMPFQCSYDRKVVLSVNAFTPKRAMIFTRTESFGNFTFTMDMYRNEEYEEAYGDDDYPIDIGIGQPMYLEVAVESQQNDSALSVVPIMCKATPTKGYDDKPQYVFINESCAKDKTIKYDFKEGNKQRWSMASFRFLPDYKNVYLHCKVTACPRGDSNSRCAVGCKDDKSRRRRREAPTRDIEFDLAVGPISQSDKQQRSMGNPKAASTGMITMVTIIAGVLGVVALALIIVVAIVLKRKQAPPKPQKLLVNEEP